MGLRDDIRTELAWEIPEDADEFEFEAYKNRLRRLHEQAKFGIANTGKAETMRELDALVKEINERMAAITTLQREKFPIKVNISKDVLDQAEYLAGLTVKENDDE